MSLLKKHQVSKSGELIARGRMAMRNWARNQIMLEDAE